MGRSSELFRSSLKVFGAGSVDRMGLSSPVRSTEAVDQQQPFLDPARLAFSKFGYPDFIIMPKEVAE